MQALAQHDDGKPSETIGGSPPPRSMRCRRCCPASCTHSKRASTVAQPCSFSMRKLGFICAMARSDDQMALAEDVAQKNVAVAFATQELADVEASANRRPILERARRILART